MKRDRLVTRLLLVLFTMLMMILTLVKSQTMVKAVTPTDITDAENTLQQYDDINMKKNNDGSIWKRQNNSPMNQIGTIPIGGGFSLGYTFGSARNSSGYVASGDRTITQPSVPNTTGTPRITNSKFNVFLDDHGKYYGIIHQGENSFIGTNGKPGNASDTSIDYALLTGNGSTDYYKDMNLLTNLATIDSNATKYFYTGTDSNGNPVFKLLGYYSKRNVFVETVLRPSITGAPFVQRELYVYNPSSTATTDFQTFFGEDTGLDPNNGDTSIDNVPMYSIGDQSGLYLLSDANYSPVSRMFVTNDVKGGFKDFMGRVLTNPTNWGIKGTVGNSRNPITNPTLPWSPTTSTQNGDTDTKANTNLLQTKDNTGKSVNVVDTNNQQDSAYVLRWPSTKLQPKQVAEFSSTIGASIPGYAIPIVSKTYSNSTSPGSTVNHVGDKLDFTLKVKNEGYQSHWSITQILDEMPKGLTIDKITTSSSYVKGDSIDFNPRINVGDVDSNNLSSSVAYTFSATINNQAPYNLKNGNLTNTATFIGNNTNLTDSKTYTSSIDIPVAIPDFNYHFTKQVKNETTNPTGSFTNEVTGKQGDIIDYNVNFNSTGSSQLKSANFADTLPDGLELVPGSVTLNGTTKGSLNFPTGTLANNTNNTIAFKAKVTGIVKSTASNTAHLTNVQTSTGKTYSSIPTENPAIVNIEDAPLTTSFVEVPQKIDFGSINFLGSERILPNVSTTGKLIITHSADTPFQVGVSYNNDGQYPIESKGTKLIQDGGQSILFSQAQTDSSNSWKPLSTDSTPIKNSGFSGSHTNYDLSNYIGPNKWKLRIPADTKAGVYNGHVTWSISDGI